MEAIRLFLARAQAVEPEFALNAATAPLVVDICRRLEGIPLAIELAAARANHLPLPALRARLERRLPLLVDGPHDLPDRLRTMRGAIAWSYDLLTANEQSLLRRMGLFPAGCRLDAVVGIGSEQDTAGNAPLRLETGRPPLTPASLANIAALTDHSLVRKVTDPDGEPRFVMLETIREYALEQLDAGGDREDAERAKAGYLLAFAEQLEFAPLVSGSERSIVLLESEQANIRESLARRRGSGIAHSGWRARLPIPGLPRGTTGKGKAGWSRCWPTGTSVAIRNVPRDSLDLATCSCTWAIILAPKPCFRRRSPCGARRRTRCKRRSPCLGWKAR